MTNLHCGYDRRVREALAELLGPGFGDRELSVSMARPFVEMPGDADTISVRSLPRLAIVVEGESDKLGPVIAAVREVRS